MRSARLRDGLVDASPKCGACNRPSAGIIRKVRKSRGKSTHYWDSACIDHLRAVAYTDPHLVKLHSKRGYINWSEWYGQEEVTL